MNDTTPDTDSGGMSRRDMLRRSALVGGAVVWMAPAVQTLAAPAFAAGSLVGGGGACEYRFFIKYDLVGGFATTDGSCPDFVTACVASGNVTVTPAAGGQSATISAGTLALGTVTATLDPTNVNCVTIDFNLLNGCNVDEASSALVVKEGNNCTGDAVQLTSATNDQTNDRYRLCSSGTPGTGTGLSHVDLCICVQCPVPA